MIIVEPNASLIASTPDAERVIEEAGRVCYRSEHKISRGSAEKFLDMIMQRGHLSVIEHASATIEFTCDRGVTHEMVRHRVASFSQESTRYCNYSRDKFENQIRVIVPPGLDAVTYDLWHSTVETVEAHYMELIDRGIKPQIARSILPNCLASTIVVTANFREWLHILKLRTSSAAHPQIRAVMEIAWDLLFDLSNVIFTQENIHG